MPNTNEVSFSGLLAERCVVDSGVSESNVVEARPLLVCLGVPAALFWPDPPPLLTIVEDILNFFIR